MAKTPTDIRSLARNHTVKALSVLASIMNQAKAPPAARVQAAQALLDRGWGKATQIVQATITNVNELTDSEIAARIAELRGIGATDGDIAPSVDPSQLN